jgi:hypothetical protein
MRYIFLVALLLIGVDGYAASSSDEDTTSNTSSKTYPPYKDSLLRKQKLKNMGYFNISC